MGFFSRLLSQSRQGELRFEMIVAYIENTEDFFNLKFALLLKVLLEGPFCIFAREKKRDAIKDYSKGQ